MAGPEPISGEPSIIVQLNRQDAQQRIQNSEDAARTTPQDSKTPTRTERVYGERDVAPVAAAPDKGADRESENNAADLGNVTETRGQNVNLVA